MLVAHTSMYVGDTTLIEIFFNPNSIKGTSKRANGVDAF